MTRQMADAVSPATFAWADLVAGYVDGAWQSFGPIAALNPGKVAVSIAAHSSTNDGIVGDCETGDMTPWSLVDWVVMRRVAGAEPSAYFSEAIRSTVESSFSVRGVPMPPEWIAGYPGSVGYGNLYPGSVAHQDADAGPYDHSTVADFWPGVDGAGPSPSHHNTGVTGMLCRDQATGAIYLIGPGYGRHVGTTDEVNRLLYVGVANAGNMSGLAVVGWALTFGAWNTAANTFVT